MIAKWSSTIEEAEEEEMCFLAPWVLATVLAGLRMALAIVRFLGVVFFGSLAAFLAIVLLFFPTAIFSIPVCLSLTLIALESAPTR